MRILYSGMYAEFEPLQYKGQPVLETVDGKLQLGGNKATYGGEYGTVTFNEDGRSEKRCVVMRLRKPEPGERMPTREDGLPHRVFSELYAKPNENMFAFPTVDDPSQTSSNQQTVQAVVSVNGRRRNLYLAKGFRYATTEDVIKCIERAATNDSNAVAQKTARDPMNQIKVLAEGMNAGLKEALIAALQANQSAQTQAGGRR